MFYIYSSVQRYDLALMLASDGKGLARPRFESLTAVACVINRDQSRASTARAMAPRCACKFTLHQPRSRPPLALKPR
jgi:hypothetical protein